MYAQLNRYGTVCCGALVALALVRPAAAEDWVCSDVPVLLVSTIDPPNYPEPICVRCKIKVTLSSSSQSPVGYVSFAYEGGSSQGFEGDLVLEVLLTSDTWQTVTIPVELEEGHDYAFPLQNGSSWQWIHAEYVWAELVPG